MVGASTILRTAARAAVSGRNQCPGFPVWSEFCGLRGHRTRQRLLRAKGLNVSWPEWSLVVQFNWFKQLLPSLCSTDSGFKKAPLDACCGGGGPYNVNFSLPCGGPMATVCKDPSKFVFWDGTHLTEAASEIVARGLPEGPYAYPPIMQTCSKIESDASQLQPVFYPTK